MWSIEKLCPAAGEKGRAMKRLLYLLLAVVLIGVLLLSCSKLRQKPEPAASGAKRIGYCQAESYYEFDFQIYEIAAALEEQGVLELPESAAERGTAAREVWLALCAASYGCAAKPCRGNLSTGQVSFAAPTPFHYNP